MDNLGLATFFAMGLGLGVLHAFDPDHLAAVGGLTSGTHGGANSATGPHKKHAIWRFAMHWSLGHGGVLLAISCAVLLLGIAVPTQVSALAEQCVAFMLIAIGLGGFWKTLKPNPDTDSALNRRHNGATFVGMVHGTAGSAPLLALLPITQMKEPAVGLIYVFLFGIGVTLAMMGLGGLLFQGFKRMHSWQGRYQLAVHIFLASFSLVLGVRLVFV